MADPELSGALERIRDLLAKTAKREEILGRDGFLALPPSLQNQMVVLQKQSELKAQTQEAIVAAESNLREYNAKLDDAFNLKRQIEGEAGRVQRARRRQATRGVIKVLVIAAVVGGGALLYRSEATTKGEACAAVAACKKEGLCSAQLSVSPFGMQCAAQGDDCQQATVCAMQGMCSAHEGVCMARVSEDCQRSKHCVEQGLCSPFGGTCVAGSSDDCKASRMCHERGACSELGGRCIVPGGFDAPVGSASATSSGPPPPLKAKPTSRPRRRP